MKEEIEIQKICDKYVNIIKSLKDVKITSIVEEFENSLIDFFYSKTKQKSYCFNNFVTLEKNINKVIDPRLNKRLSTLRYKIFNYFYDASEL